MSWNLVAHGTTGAIDTTGADLLIGIGSNYASTSVFTDSKGNTWTALTDEGNPNSCHMQMSYSIPTSVGSSHTFTNTGSGFGGQAIMAWSGGKQVSPFDTESAGNGAAGVTSIQPGSVTPSEANCLIITGFANEGDETSLAIDSGFTISDYHAYINGVRIGAAGAYLVETSIAAQNPTWSWTNAINVNVGMAVFKMAAGAAGIVIPTISRRAKLN